MRSFTIPRDPLDMGHNLYRKETITIESGVTVLVGCNGAGKSTLIQMISQDLRKNRIPFLTFNNLTEGGAFARSKAGFYGDFDFLATAFCSSEGENIIMNIGSFARDIGKMCRETPEAKEAWFFFDAVDSGLSVDNIVDLKRELFDAMLSTNAGKDIYIVISANEYELAREEACFDVWNGEYTRFDSYESYRNFILQSRMEKDRRSKKPTKRKKVSK